MSRSYNQYRNTAAKTLLYYMFFQACGNPLKKPLRLVFVVFNYGFFALQFFTAKQRGLKTQTISKLTVQRFQ